MMFRWAEECHQRMIAGRRIKVLAGSVQHLIPVGASVLDVGCGDGRLAAKICAYRPDIAIQGLDVVGRDQFRIPTILYDGQRIPFADSCFETVILIDVLHHSQDISALMQECFRVARSGIIIKDHLLQGILAGKTLEFMDRIGNFRFNVNLQCSYLTRKQWQNLFDFCGLDITEWSQQLGIYPWPLSLFFERNLHFLAYLSKSIDYTG